MIVMPSNHSKGIVHYWAGRNYPVGWLLTPDSSLKTPICNYMPYAIDNGRFAVWSDGREWNEDNFIKYLDFYCTYELQPRWIVVPDAVGNKNETLEEWKKWYPSLKEYGVPLAFVVQDGMTKEDVPEDADIIFIGGTFAWKWETIRHWTENFERIHVGRVNTYNHLQTCRSLGVESCDGTGWFRHPDRWRGLEKYFMIESGEMVEPQLELKI
jgi:hypothetical protein